MTQLDQFESVFRAADKAVFEYTPPLVRSIMLVSDLDDDASAALVTSLEQLLAVLAADGPDWTVANDPALADPAALVEHVERAAPDLVITWRHLFGTGWRAPYGLGTSLEVLTQHTRPPVLVLPHPDGDQALPHTLRNSDRVLALTNHLVGDGSLVSWALRLTQPGGQCWLAHLEDSDAFERVMEEIGKIPEIDTDTARELLAARMLADARDFAERCAAEVAEQRLSVELHAEVGFGCQVADTVRLVEQHEIDLCVLHTKDADQLAMHGLAYPLAVQLRSIPLLML